LHRTAEQGPVTNVADEELDPAGRQGRVEVLVAAAYEIVDQHDRVEAGPQRLVADRGTDEAGATGDQDAGSGESGKWGGPQRGRFDGAHADTSETLSSIGWGRPPLSIVALAAWTISQTRHPPPHTIK